MNEFRSRAVDGLMQFEQCEARDSLIRLMEYITTRNK
jgi:octaprenyl-diphosphate synthase